MSETKSIASDIASSQDEHKSHHEYFAQRQLKQGAVGWILLVGLGVAYVISGDFAGWNFGLAQGGWGGMFIATVVVAIMYLCMCLAMSEMSTMLPTAGGGYSFARTAFGPLGGYLTGTAILIEYAIAPAAIAVFIGAYCQSLFGIGGWIVYLVCYLIFMGIHLKGAGEALKIMFVITAVACVALFVFIIAMIPHFNSANLFNIAVTDHAGASNFLPMGYIGIWAAVPYAIWFFLAVEGVPLAAEEAKDPAKSLPRGLIGSMLILAAFALLILFFRGGCSRCGSIKSLWCAIGGCVGSCLWQKYMVGQFCKFCWFSWTHCKFLFNYLCLFTTNLRIVSCRLFT